MYPLKYQATYIDGETEEIRVRARNVNTGFTKALRLANQPLGSGRQRRLVSLVALLPEGLNHPKV